MRSLISLIIFADGAAALVGAVLAACMRQVEDTGRRRWPALARILTLGLAGYSVARLGVAWNQVANGGDLVDCVALVSPRFTNYRLFFLSIQCGTAWGATIWLAMKLVNGHFERLRNHVAGLFKKR